MRRIVCLCGSTRFWEDFRDQGLAETLAGRIVLSIGIHAPDSMTFAHAEDDKGRGIKRDLDELHLDKIDLADEVLILNRGGYLGDSTKRELSYAVLRHKDVRWLEPEMGESFMERNSHELGQIMAQLALDRPRSAAFASR